MIPEDRIVLTRNGSGAFPVGYTLTVDDVEFTMEEIAEVVRSHHLMRDSANAAQEWKQSAHRLSGVVAQLQDHVHESYEKLRITERRLAESRDHAERVASALAAATTANTTQHPSCVHGDAVQALAHAYLEAVTFDHVARDAKRLNKAILRVLADHGVPVKDMPQ